MSEPSATPWSDEIEAFYEDQSREIWALFYAQCNDPERAYDALQESFARLQKQDGAEIRDKRAWVIQVGRNWLRDVARRQKIAAKPSDYLDDLADTPAEPADLVEKAEINEKIREILVEMREEDRKVLVLRYALGWSSIQIGISLDTTAAAVDMRLSRARRRLGQLLKQRGIVHEAS